MWFIAKKVELYLVTVQSSPQGKEKNMNVNSQFVTNNPMTLCHNDEIDSSDSNTKILVEKEATIISNT